jgi:hypothetical protein
MDHSEPSPQQQLLQSIDDLLAAAAKTTAAQPSCSRCGKASASVPAMFWLYGTDRVWNMRLPLCACELEKASSLTEPRTYHENLAA